MKKQIIALFMLSLSLLAGCGQTGPLYHPEDESQTTNSDVAQPNEDTGVTTIE